MFLLHLSYNQNQSVSARKRKMRYLFRAENNMILNQS